MVLGCTSVAVHPDGSGGASHGAPLRWCVLRAVYLGGEDRAGGAAWIRSSGSRQLLLGGGVAPVVRGLGGRLDNLLVTGQALLGGHRGHQSVDRHAGETRPDPGYDGNPADLLV